MSAWRAMLGIFAVAALTVAGCGSAEESTTEAEGKKAEEAESKEAAKDSEGTEFYQYVSKKKKPAAAETVEKKFYANQKYTFPQDSKTPEVVADVTVYSDKSMMFDGAFEEFRSDGKTKHAVGAFKNDHRDGKWTYYHPKGQVAKEVNYVDGRLDGSWTHFTEDGSKQYDATFKNGKQNGTWTFYAPRDKDGKQAISQTMQFKDGKADGSVVQFYANGQKRAERRFENGVAHGVQNLWYEDGTKYYEATFEKGKQNGTETIWDAKGKVVKRREFRDGSPLVTADSDAKKSDESKKAKSAS